MARYDVAFYAPYIGPLLAGAGSTGGGETQILLLATELAKRGRRVALVAFQGAQPLPREFGGVSVIPIRRPRHRGVPSRPAAGALLAARLVRALDAEVVVQRAAGSATGLVALMARLRRRRFVYASASIVDFEPERLGLSRPGIAAFRLGVRLADAVVVQSVEQEVLFRDAFRGRCEVVHSLAEPAPPRSEQPEALMWIGRFAPYKRPLAALDGAAAAPEARFTFVGWPSPLDPGLVHEVRRRAAELPNVELLDARPREQLLAMLSRAVAIVSTSDFEGMPNVFLEGWARGVPALALHHDPDGVIERERVGWYADGDRERFAAAVREAWATRGEQQELSALCRAFVERRHGPAAVAAAWDAILFPR